MFYSCEKDNLEGPDAIFAGELRDRKTGELIQQEISDGSRVYFIEQGWGDNPPVQNMVVKKDGTFYNGMIFSGDYKIILNRGYSGYENKAGKELSGLRSESLSADH